MNAESLSTVRELMDAFAYRTGLTSDVPSRRYLWTDGFAVCAFLDILRQTGDEHYLDLAVRLVEQVHHTLGRHRDDDDRSGWISGLGEEEGEKHPTAGGLRIGKELPERGPEAPIDRRMEWERDGQYYHYLTKWMHALSRLGSVTGKRVYHLWALELAEAAHRAFVIAGPDRAPRRMVWKMSIDLSYPLVSSMGQHDPLDGFVTYLELTQAASDEPSAPDLDAEIREMRSLCQGLRWETEDALGIGGLLTDGFRLAQLVLPSGGEERDLLANVLGAAAASLDQHVRFRSLDEPLRFRLAFRELGLALGLRAVPRLKALADSKRAHLEEVGFPFSRIEDLAGHDPLRETIETQWREAARKGHESWMNHQDINTVMLATSLAPESYLSV
jgi:hypothetical protein